MSHLCVLKHENWCTLNFELCAKISTCVTLIPLHVLGCRYSSLTTNSGFATVTLFWPLVTDKHLPCNTDCYMQSELLYLMNTMPIPISWCKINVLSVMIFSILNIVFRFSHFSTAINPAQVSCTQKNFFTNLVCYYWIFQT